MLDDVEGGFPMVRQIWLEVRPQIGDVSICIYVLKLKREEEIRKKGRASSQVGGRVNSRHGGGRVNSRHGERERRGDHQL